MSRAAVSVFVFGIYLTILGGGLLVAPNSVIGVFGLPPTREVWIAVMAMLLLILGSYYLLAARTGLTAFFRWTVPLRASVILFFGAFVAAGLVAPVLLLFGVIDVAGASWTWLALQADERQATAAP